MLRPQLYAILTECVVNYSAEQNTELFCIDLILFDFTVFDCVLLYKYMHLLTWFFSLVLFFIVRYEIKNAELFMMRD